MDNDWLSPFVNKLIIKNQPLPDEFNCPKCNFKPRYLHGGEENYEVQCPQCNHEYEVEFDV